MRSLAFDFRNDKNVYNIPDQYMFGPAFLVKSRLPSNYIADKNAGTPAESKRKCIYQKVTNGLISGQEKR